MRIGLQAKADPYHRTPVRRALEEGRSCETQEDRQRAPPSVSCGPKSERFSRGACSTGATLPCKQGVAGASPVSSTNFHLRRECWFSEGFHTPFDTGSIPVSATILRGCSDQQIVNLPSEKKGGRRRVVRFHQPLPIRAMTCGETASRRIVSPKFSVRVRASQPGGISNSSVAQEQSDRPISGGPRGSTGRWYYLWLGSSRRRARS